MYLPVFLGHLLTDNLSYKSFPLLYNENTVPSPHSRIIPHCYENLTHFVSNMVERELINRFGTLFYKYILKFSKDLFDFPSPTPISHPSRFGFNI